MDCISCSIYSGKEKNPSVSVKWYTGCGCCDIINEVIRLFNGQKGMGIQ